MSGLLLQKCYITDKSISQDSIYICGRIPWHKNQVNIDPDTKTNNFPTPTQKTNQLRSLRWNQVKLDARHWNQVNFDTHTKTKRFAARIQKPSKFWPPTQKPSHSITTLKSSHFRLAQSQFRPPAQRKVNSDLNTKTKSNSISHTKIKLNLTPPMKIKLIRSPLKKQVCFDAPTQKPR